MKVCLDIQSAIAQRAGVGRYTRMLAEQLGARAGESRLVLFSFDFKGAGIPFEHPHAVQKRITWCPGRLAQAAWKTIGWPPFDWFAGPCDLYHFPNFILPPLSRGKSVVTIHDVSFMRFPEWAETRNLAYLSSRIRDTVRRADAILTDSEFSASEIRALLHVNPDRLYPIPLGIDDAFHAPEPARAPGLPPEWRIDRPYLLNVGTVEPRKNLGFLLDVFEGLKGFDGLLIIAGMPGWKCEPFFERLRASSRASDIRYLRYVEDARLPALYAGAEAFVLTSHYEGFGFPPLEAAACGAVVVSSTGGSLREVLGDGALLVDGFEVETWRGQLARALSDSALRKDLREKGRRRASLYRWADTARRTWEVYGKVTGERP